MLGRPGFQLHWADFVFNSLDNRPGGAGFADAILDCSKRGGIILDVFAGSGTTLIAAEKAGRRGYGIEIDCHYADIIIRRFDEVFGLKAVHAESKLDFERLTNERFKEKRHGQKAKNGKGHRAKDR